MASIGDLEIRINAALVEEIKRLAAEIDRLCAENAEAAAKVKKYEDILFALGAMDKAPCFCCGYNGSGYYQPDMHPCAKRHHDT
jgi:hypothetical protein